MYYRKDISKALFVFSFKKIKIQFAKNNGYVTEKK